MSTKGRQATGKHAAGKLRPHVWVSGPDPIIHKKYLTWLQQRNQARFRGEEWDLSFEKWSEMWEEHWFNRGRASENYCMTREDPDGPWDETNTIVITRLEQLRRHRERQTLLGQTTGYRKKLAALNKGE